MSQMPVWDNELLKSIRDATLEQNKILREIVHIMRDLRDELAIQRAHRGNGLAAVSP